jgi:hypothetical protein
MPHEQMEYGGLRFGKLTVLEPDRRMKAKNGAWVWLWICLCDCGRLCSIRAANFERTSSCGCLGRPRFVGMRFGRLLVKARESSGRRGQCWSCECDCGNTCSVMTSAIVFGQKSCGCLRDEATILRNFRHGLTKREHRTAELDIYHGARRRCTNPQAKSWKDYGGRGIEFRFTSFEQFMKELGPRPSLAHSVDRKDNDGHYEPGNVRWATKLEQRRNQRPPVYTLAEFKRFVERYFWPESICVGEMK